MAEFIEKCQIFSPKNGKKLRFYENLWPKFGQTSTPKKNLLCSYH